MLPLRHLVFLAGLSAPLQALGAGDDPLPRGEALLGELSCTACHAAPEAVLSRIAPKAAPDLARVGARVTPGYLRRFLADPHATKPGTSMPDVLGGLREGERTERVELLVHYLASLGGPIDESPVPTSPGAIESGRQLFHRTGCVACHAPDEPAWQLEIPYWDVEPEDGAEDGEHVPAPPGTLPPPDVPLGDLARKTTVDALARFLLDPLAVRPSGRMPAMGLTESEARELALYLLRGQVSGADELAPGLALEYYEADFAGSVHDFDQLDPVRKGVQAAFGLPKDRRDENFGIRLSGFVEVERGGLHTFATTSDDGSRLWIDGELIVRNDGQHPMTRAQGDVELERGRHAIVVTFFEHQGGEGLEVAWSGPGFDDRPIPAERLSHASLVCRPPEPTGFRVDARLAARGRSVFIESGCASCHTSLAEQRATGASAGRGLAELDLAAGGGCLDPAPPAGVPRFDLAAEDRAALRAAGTSDLGRALGPEETLARTLSRMRCYACHRRDDVGGAHPDRRDFFFEVGAVDLGEEGRIPPHLDDAGYKLRRSYVEAVLFEGAAARPYVATRMPRFGIANVGHLPALFEELDARPGDEREPAFTLEAVDDGRRLVGTKGLGCIQCHTLAGFDSLGIPATDLAGVHERIKPAWFKELLLDPLAVNMNTRMPELWQDGASPVADVLDGDPARQIDAIRVYLSLGASAPLPEGLNVPEGEYELVATGRPRLVGVFMKDVSPRTLCVGFPLHTHYAFDLQHSRLAKAWRGRFFNAKGTWHARAGELELPPSQDVLELPQGPTFVLGDPGSPETVEPRALGRRFDGDGLPSFRYELGGIEIEEQPVPVLGEDGTRLVRRFRVTGLEPGRGLWMRVLEGGAVGQDADGTWLSDGGVTARLPEDARPLVHRTEGGRRELLLPVTRESFEVEIRW